jgi:hypothetical protein
MSLDKTEYSMDLLDSLRLSMEYIVYWYWKYGIIPPETFTN